MAAVQNPARNARVKKHPKSLKASKVYCILCRKDYLKPDGHEHMHSMLHHRELEAVLGKNTLHDCQACKKSSLGLNEYAEHISTPQHQARLENLMAKNVKPVSLYKSLKKETIEKILKRNKALKKEEHKFTKKHKKKTRQVAGQRWAGLQQGTITQKTNQKPDQMQMRWSNQMQQSPFQGNNHPVVQNKENNMSGPFLCRDPALQNQSWRQACYLGNFVDRPQHQLAQGVFPQSARHLRFDDSFPGSHLPTNHVRQESSQSDGPQVDQGFPVTQNQKTMPSINQNQHFYGQHTSSRQRDFRRDVLPENGSFGFECCQGDRTESKTSNPSDRLASENKTAPQQDVDVSTMLKQIRRALGVREPCRADREARRQNSEACSHMTMCSTAKQAEVAGNSLNSHNCAPTVPSSAGVCSSRVTAQKPKLPITVEGMSDSGKEDSQVNKSSDSLNRSTGLSEPNMSGSRKVRIAHKSSGIHAEEEAVSKPPTGAKDKLSWRQMYEMKINRRSEGSPRFGIKLSNHQTELQSSVNDNDLPLSEGFHWETIPDCSTEPHLTPPPPPHFSSAGGVSDAQVESLQEREAAQSSCKGQTTVKVKEELNLEDYEMSTNANKRKLNALTDNTLADSSNRKKKKTKSTLNQDQMDHLLAVSLKEDELSRSLQDVDTSLIQARNAVQAAYAEVQRLLLLKQQFTVEVNSLRAKRIEILQEMQEGYSGASNAVERATTSSAVAASSSQQPFTAAPAPFNTQPFSNPLVLSAVPLNQEVSHVATTGQASLLPTALSGTADVPQVTLTPPVPLFPPDLLTPLLLRPPLVPPLTDATSARRDLTESGKASSEASAQQREHDTGKGINESQSVGIGLVEKVGNETGADMSVPERQKKADRAEDEGNESDVSVEMVSSSKVEVIEVDESECENSVETNSKDPQESANVEVSSTSTQTSQQNQTDGKFKPVKDDVAPAGSVEDQEPSVGVFSSHAGPVHGLQIHDGILYTCSADNTARAYNLVTRECQAVFQGHTNKVNCLLVSIVPYLPARLYTGSSDQTIRCYSLKSKRCLQQISLPDRVLCLHVAWNILYAGLASGSVFSYDLKTLKELDVFECHGPRGVSCLGTAQEGARRLLLVGSYDSTISVRDAKSGLLLRSLEGHTKTVLCMKVVNDLVFSGSSDTSVHAHNIHTGELVRIYKGHGHAVTSIVILGKVMVTASLDKLVRVYELQSHDRLQVYGGHSDMVVCMTVHKSLIYTGCYDGTVQAVKLNLMKNYRCWWQNCSLIFGMAEHLLQHLVGDHSHPNLQTVKCRWKGCNAFFSTQQSVRKELPEHMQSHIENDSMQQP
uniref:C2H2-type domain-containing protein n=1 Tax=Oryzias sinensis TaxID=183150 RepID=A0A8C7Z4K6_9TELE